MDARLNDGLCCLGCRTGFIRILRRYTMESLEQELFTNLYTGIPEIITQFHVSEELGILGLSLYVAGFAIGRKFSTISLPCTIY
jgi:hypothetical protein